MRSYNLQLSIDQNINSGTAPSTAVVPHDNTSMAGFLTLYDFAGYVDGTCAGPAGWGSTARDVGFTPDDVMPVDNHSIVNLTWARTSGPTLLGQPDGIDLGMFSAQSIYNTITMVSYTSRGIKNIGSREGTISDNVGNVQGPIGPSVLEPVNFALAGLALALLTGRIRSRKS